MGWADAGRRECGVKAGALGAGMDCVKPIAVRDSTNDAELADDEARDLFGENGRGERFWSRRERRG